MKKYKIEFKTNMNQDKPYARIVEAKNREEAIAQIKADAQITNRFIVSCKLHK